MKNQIDSVKSSTHMPSPSNISMWWNLGSMLGFMMSLQLSTGLFLSMNYCPSIKDAFQSVVDINNNDEIGWCMRNIHANGASVLFMLMYIHIIRGIYYYSFKNTATWLFGVGVLMTCMASAFLGYILPWGQMSFWGATVITNLLSAIPYMGQPVVEWIWGGPSINNATLNRFYTLHFVTPFIMMFMVTMHLAFLHKSGSSNPMGLKSSLYMVPLTPYFMLKDYIGFLFMFSLIMFMITVTPFVFADPDNFTPANSMVTPDHIKPEWYFLFAYSILRSIPNKFGGVLCLVSSILAIALLPFHKIKKPSAKFTPLSQALYWILLISLFVLTWTGGCPVEYPYTILSQMASIGYFSFFCLLGPAEKLWFLMEMHKKSSKPTN